MDTIIQLKLGKTMFQGRVTYDEGDLVEAVFPEKIPVSVGESVGCMMTSNYEEIKRFDGVILAKEHDRLFIFHSPTATEFRQQRRRYPRLDVEVDGWIHILDGTELPVYITPKVKMENISLGGVAFRYDKPIPVKTKLILYTELYGRYEEEGFIHAHLEVIHHKQNDGYTYGCKVTNISGKCLRRLRKYILQRQLTELKRK